MRQSISQMPNATIWFDPGPLAGIGTVVFVSRLSCRARASFRGCVDTKKPETPDLFFPLHPTTACAVADSPDILKYFYEEPVLMEPVTPDADPDARRRAERPERGPGASGPSMPIDQLLQTDDYYRGYLAGTRTDGAPDPDTDRVGLTALPDPEVYVTPLLEALGHSWWAVVGAEDDVQEIHRDTAARRFAAPEGTAALITASDALPPERAAAVVGRGRREALAPLRAVLDAGAVVFFPERAHDGFDWSFFGSEPMRDRLVAAFRANPAPGLRRFVLPYQKARSESKFYFETWQLKEPSLPDYIEEV